MDMVVILTPDFDSGRIAGCLRGEGFRHEDAQEVRVWSPVTGADLSIAPGPVHLDQFSSRLGCVERHDLATLESGMLQCSIVDAPSVALALMSWRDGKLTERPRVLVAQERNLGLGVGFAERDGGDQFSIYLANEADASGKAPGCVLDGLVGCPIAEPLRRMRRVGGTNQSRECHQVFGLGCSSEEHAGTLVSFAA